MTADVDVTANPNEIRDFKYVDKAELQAMFEAPGTFSLSVPSIHPLNARTHPPLHSTNAFTHATLPCMHAGNSFTPWFKLIARDFLFGWWDELLNRRDSEGRVNALTLDGLVDGSKVIKMV